MSNNGQLEAPMDPADRSGDQSDSRECSAIADGRLVQINAEALSDLKRQIRLLEGVASTTPDFVYVFDLGGRFLYANKRLLEVWGMRLQDVIGKTCLELGYEPWHHEMHMREIAEVIATKRPIKGEVPFRAPVTGLFGIYEYIFSPVLTPGGEVELVSGTTRDVTSRKQAEEAHRKSEERYRELFTSMTEGFCVIERIEGPAGEGVDFRYVEANPAMATQSGIQNVLGRTIRQAVPEEAEGWIRIYDHVAKTGEAARFQRDLTTVGRTLELYAYRIGSEARYLVGVVFRDITQQKKDEARLQRTRDTFNHLIQNNPFGIYVVDSDFRLQQVSLGAQKVFSGVRPLLGRDFAEVLRILWTEPFATEAIGRFHHTFETGEPYNSPKTVARRQDLGDVEAYDWRIERIVLPDGRPGVVCYFYDLSERQRWEAALQESEEKFRALAASLETTVEERTAKLREMITELEALSYSISHDMRAPLRAMQGFSQALLEDYRDRLDNEGALHLERISGAATRLDSLIQDILLYTKVSREKPALAAIELEAVIQETIKTHHPGQEYLVTIEGPLPRVLAHEAFLSQIFSNLITNALKFVRPGQEPEVRIRCEDDDACVKVWVEDKGLGIAPEHLGRIFQVFGRVYSESEYPGTGIGLAIAKRAVERLGGQLGVVSKLGEGSKFWFTLQKA